MSDFMQPDDWDREFKVTEVGKVHLARYPQTRSRLTQYFTEEGFATHVLHHIDLGRSNRWISNKLGGNIGDSIRVARAMTYLLEGGYITR